MLVGEVARVAGVPRETLRVWLRREFFGFSRPKGTWKRFSDFETVIIGVFAALVRATQDHDLAQLGALLAGKVLMDEWTEDETGVPYFSEDTFDKDRFLFFWRDAEGSWTGDIKASPDEAYAEINVRLDDSYSNAPIFTVVNFGAVLKHTLVALLKVQIEMPANASESEE
jgi:MerR HTH family regulatory protein